MLLSKQSFIIQTVDSENILNFSNFLIPLQMSLEGTNCPFVQIDSVAPTDWSPLPQVNDSLSDCLYSVFIGNNVPLPSIVGLTVHNTSAKVQAKSKETQKD